MTSRAIIPATPDECMILAKHFYTAEFIKCQYKSAGEVFFIINLGLEVGLSPAQAVQNIAIISNRACIWGDALLAIVKNHKDFVYCEETTEGSIKSGSFTAYCEISRLSLPKEKLTQQVKRSFSIDDAKQAGLWIHDTKDWRKKKLPWASYPERMLQMRARTFAIRDSFPDAIKGLTSIEEARDIKLDAKEIKALKQKRIPEKLSLTDLRKKYGRKKSKLLNEYFIQDDARRLHMESGITYTLSEVEDLMLLNKEEAKQKHENSLNEKAKDGLILENLYTKMFTKEKKIEVSDNE